MKMYNKFPIQNFSNSLVLFFLLVFFSSCNLTQKEILEDDQGFREAKLSSQAPEALGPLMDEISSQLGLSNILYSSFETGIDTVNVYFGSMNQGEKVGYWVSLQIKEKISWSTASLIAIDTLAFPANNIDLNFDDDAKRISLRVMHSPDTDEIYYSWLNQGDQSQDALIVEIEAPIRINKPFPGLELELMNGDKMDTNEFSGKFMVINWWHTGCGPCIAAISGLNTLVDKYRENSKVVFLAIAFDKRERVENFLSKRDFFFLHSIGNKETSERFGESFPKYIIVNPDGIITYYTAGGSEKSYEPIDASLANQIYLN